MKDFAVVVPTKSRPDEVLGLFSCLSAWTCRPKVVIVVDSSTDNFTERACMESPLWTSSTLIYLRSDPGAGRQRNMGVSHAHKLGIDHIAMLDDDIRPGPDFLQSCIAMHHGLGKKSVVGGWDFNVTPTPNSKIRSCLGFSAPEQGFYITKAGHAVYGNGGAHPVQSTHWLPGGMMFGRTEAFVAHPYRDDFLIYGDDLDLCLRLRADGFQLATGDELSVIHLSAESGKEARWRSHLGYFRFRYWLATQPNAGVKRKWVVINSMVSIFYSFAAGLLGDRPRFFSAVGEVLGLIEAGMGRSGPTRR